MLRHNDFYQNSSILLWLILPRPHFAIYRHWYYPGFNNSVKRAIYNQFGIVFLCAGLLCCYHRIKFTVFDSFTEQTQQPQALALNVTIFFLPSIFMTELKLQINTP